MSLILTLGTVAGFLIWQRWSSESELLRKGAEITRGPDGLPREIVVDVQQSERVDLSALAHLKSIHSLTIQGSTASGKELAALLRECPHIQSLTIREMQLAPAEVLSLLTSTNVRRLHLVACHGFTSDELAAVSAALELGRMLVLSEQSLSPDEYQRLHRLGNVVLSIKPETVNPVSERLRVSFSPLREPPEMSLTTIEPATRTDLQELRYPEVVFSLTGRLAPGASEYLPRFSQLEQLTLEEADDATLADVGALASLQRLTLTRGRFTDRALASLARLADLEWLHLQSTNVRGDGFESLAPLHQVRSLWVDCPNAEPSAFAALRRLPKVDSLQLINQGLHLDDIHFLREMPDLTYVDLSGNPLDNTAIELLESIPQLGGATLWGCPIDEAAQLAFYERMENRGQEAGAASRQ